ncbi:hypothetical protein ACQEVZ_33045 [Dactylosporangium sp. CA-152071]|uniref:hypothetical protein n=1 Tax=Dactylosporangium sp. CA-152071 TaxID=3239933 RepID=UPI003D8C9ED2
MHEMTGADIDVAGERHWLRLSCPGCRGWLGVPGEVPPGMVAQLVARRIDAFVQRHARCGR